MGILAITLCTFAACDTAHKKQMPNGENTVSTDINGKALSLEVEWIKNKRKSLDMSLVLRNGYEQWVTYKKRSWNLTFNGRPSEVKRYDFSGEIGPGRIEKGIIIFAFQGNVEEHGHGVLTLDPVSTSGDASGKQEVPAAPLTFKFDL